MITSVYNSIQQFCLINFLIMKHLLLTLFVLIAAIQVNAQKSASKKSANKGAIPAVPSIIYDKAEIKFDTLSHDFKEVFEGKDAVYVFKFYNIGKEPLTLSDARPGCSCTVSDYTKEPVMPGKSGSVTVKYTTTGRIGPFSKSVTVTTNSFKSPVVTLLISGVVLSSPQETH